MDALRRRLATDRPDVIHFQWLPLPLVDRHFLAGAAPGGAAGAHRARHQPVQRQPELDGAAPRRRRGVHPIRPADRAYRAGLRAAAGTGARRREAGVAAARAAGRGSAVAAARPDAMASCASCCSARSSRTKACDLLIEAFARLPEALRAQARLLVIGKPYMDLAAAACAGRRARRGRARQHRAALRDRRRDSRRCSVPAAWQPSRIGRSRPAAC